MSALKVIGLAGPSGSGKTTVARHLAGRGAVHIDADGIGHEVLEDADIRDRIRVRFGDAVFEGEGVDRGSLGRVVFADAEAREALDAIVHPTIGRIIQDRLAAIEAAGGGVAVVDAALLLAVDVPFKLDLIIGLRCGRGERGRRLRAAGGGDVEQIDARLDAQGEMTESLERADVVVDTERPLVQVIADIDRVVSSFFKR